MDKSKRLNGLFTVFAAVMLGISAILTFTVSDYYIFDKFDTYDPLFIICQWIKKSGLLLLAVAAFLKKRSCADIAKYLLPVFVIISFFRAGGFFDITMLTPEASGAQKVYASINEFLPRTARVLLFYLQGELMLACCAVIFVRDGFKVSPSSFRFLPVALIAVMPLNIFENFYNENLFDNRSPEYLQGHFLLFKSFSVWHLLALAILVASTVGCYYFLKNKPKNRQNDYLIAIAIVLLIQYHSKDSVVMGDGYNVYTTVFACIPLFICNIGVYVACLSVILKKRVLYAISFFVHAPGALTVFAYFGDAISNYGIFCGYSILYFCLTHCLLFILSVMPTALGHYKFKPSDSIIPLIYYCIVIITAAVSGGLVTSASMGFTYDGYTLSQSEWLYPNYAFTQNNPIGDIIDVPNVLPLKIWKCTMNGLYLILLYLVYVGLFYIFNGAYYAFIAVRKKLFRPEAAKNTAGLAAEVAATDDKPQTDEKKH